MIISPVKLPVVLSMSDISDENARRACADIEPVVAPVTINGVSQLSASADAVVIAARDITTGWPAP